MKRDRINAFINITNDHRQIILCVYTSFLFSSSIQCISSFSLFTSKARCCEHPQQITIPNAKPRQNINIMITIPLAPTTPPISKDDPESDTSLYWPLIRG
eukprot:209554_1